MREGIKEFRDPIHGFIEVFPHEGEIIDTFPFQRLRRISQLGLTSYLYPGAEHSRFGHSLGVMHLAGKATQLLVNRHEDLICETAGWTKKESKEQRRRIFLMARLAGLLHDVGHAPFSHTGEADLFEGNLRHEDYSAEIVANTEIGEIIDERLRDQGITKDDVVGLLRDGAVPAGCVFIHQLIDGAYDVDKMDYLLRDSHYCGVEYGLFDVRRLIDTLTLFPEEDGSLILAVEYGGYHTLEALVIARYFMFTQVYFHGVRRAYDLIVTDLIKELLKDEYDVSCYPGTEKLNEYLAWDDSRVLSRAVEIAEPENLGWMITHRRHPKVAYQTLPHPDALQARTAIRRLLPAVREKYPEVALWRDKATDHPQRYQQEDIPIEVTQTKPPGWNSFVDTASVLRGLEDIGQVRLYAYVSGNDKLLNEIRGFCRQLLA